MEEKHILGKPNQARTTVRAVKVLFYIDLGYTTFIAHIEYVVKFCIHDHVWTIL